MDEWERGRLAARHWTDEVSDDEAERVQQAEHAHPSALVAAVDEAVDAALDRAEAGARGVWDGVRSLAGRAAGGLGVRVSAPGGAPAPSFTLSATSKATTRLTPPPTYRPRPAVAGEGSLTAVLWTAAALAVVGGLALLARARAQARARGPGRWVRDRSLGGRMVWLPDAAGGAWAKVPTFIDDEGVPDGETLGATASGLTVGTGPASAQTASALPPWWDAALATRDAPNPAPPNAVLLLRGLEDSKVAGRDYDIAELVALATVLADAGASVRASTTNVRDALFRSACEAAAAAAGGGSPLDIGGMAPARLVCGLAGGLGMPVGTAANIACAAVAARARALLVDALAAQREKDETAALLALASLSALLDALSLPPGGPYAPVVAAALGGRARPDERATLLQSYAAIDPQGAGAAAELLGVDPGPALGAAGGSQEGGLGDGGGRAAGRDGGPP